MSNAKKMRRNAVDAIKYIDSKKTLFLLGWMMLTGIGTLQMQPVLGGALVDHWGLSLQQMGLLFGIELIAMAAGCLSAALAANQHDRRRICQAGLLILALGSCMSALQPVYGLLCLSRFISVSAAVSCKVSSMPRRFCVPIKIVPMLSPIRFCCCGVQSRLHWCRKYCRWSV